MTLWTKVKIWAGVVGAVGFLILLLLQRIYTLGSKSAKAENAIALEKAREKLDERLAKTRKAADSIKHAADGGVLDIRADDGHKRKRKSD